jgi:hypothetical protein
MMTPKQIDLIRQSFDAVWPVRRKLAVTFYSRFFELAPDVQQLFPSDMERQHLKLMDSIAAIVGALDKRELSGAQAQRSVTRWGGESFYNVFARSRRERGYRPHCSRGRRISAPLVRWPTAGQ